MASTYLSKTFSSDTTAGRRKWTWSAWVKRSTLGTASWLFHAWVNASNENSIFFDSSDRLSFSIYEGNNNNNGRLRSTRKFRDTNAWYHLQFVWDSANSTASDRMIIYVNNERLTAFDDNISGGSNHQTLINKSGTEHSIGRYGSGTYYFGGYISHVHFSDGYALAPTVFGEEDASTGEWKIKTDPSFTLGTNGFTILKDGNTITDQSTNSNNWTLGGGTLTKTEDCPSNVFCTFNSLEPQANGFTLENGNLSTNGNSSNVWRSLFGTLANTSGKFYYECKIATGYADGGNNSFEIGVADIDQVSNSNSKFAGLSRGYAYQQSGNKLNNNSGTSYGSRIYIGSIVCVAVDLDNNKIYFRRDNNAWENSGDPTSGSTGTGSAFDLASGYTYAPAFATYYSADDLQLNFGNGYFGTTAVSSAGTNASGIGIFEYDVPTGYTALSTKGLNL